jgi:hypothetical protein
MRRLTLALVLAHGSGCLVDNPAFQGGATTSTTSSSSSSETSDSDSASASESDDGGDDEPWWDRRWACRRRLTVTNDTEEALVELPVMVRLTPERFDLASASPGGADLRVIAADHLTELDHEIERWDLENANLWIKLPALPPGQLDLFLYWCGEASPMAAASDVWSDSFAAVYHLSDPLDEGALEPLVRDSTGLHHGRARGGITDAQREPGDRGFALRFTGKDDGAGDFIGLDHQEPLSTAGWDAITLEAWALQAQRGEMRILCQSPSTTVAQHVFAIGMHGGGGDESNERPYVRLGTDVGDAIELDGGVPVPENTWFYVALTWSSASGLLRVFIDGQQAAEHPLAGATLRSDPTYPAIGNLNGVSLDDPNNDRFWRGLLDELRIHKIARTPAWIALQHRAMRDLIVDYSAPDERL